MNSDQSSSRLSPVSLDEYAWPMISTVVELVVPSVDVLAELGSERLVAGENLHLRHAVVGHEVEGYVFLFQLRRISRTSSARGIAGAYARRGLAPDGDGAAQRALADARSCSATTL